MPFRQPGRNLSKGQMPPVTLHFDAKLTNKVYYTYVQHSVAFATFLRPLLISFEPPTPLNNRASRRQRRDRANSHPSTHIHHAPPNIIYPTPPPVAPIIIIIIINIAPSSYIHKTIITDQHRFRQTPLV